MATRPGAASGSAGYGSEVLYNLQCAVLCTSAGTTSSAQLLQQVPRLMTVSLFLSRKIVVINRTAYSASSTTVPLFLPRKIVFFNQREESKAAQSIHTWITANRKQKPGTPTLYDTKLATVALMSSDTVSLNSQCPSGEARKEC